MLEFLNLSFLKRSNLCLTQIFLVLNKFICSAWYRMLSFEEMKVRNKPRLSESHFLVFRLD
jgi:hypothetical protein